MTSIAKLMRNFYGPRLRSVSASPNTSAILTTDGLIEEQTLPRYSPQHYYPVRLGETFHDRYRVIAKLGYGASSTVWLARDIQKYVLLKFGCQRFASIDLESRWRWQSTRYVALKILTNRIVEKTAANAELETSRCIAATNSKSEGLRYLRTVLTSFKVIGPDATHTGLVYAPMRDSLSVFRRRFPGHQIPTYFLKPLLTLLLTGLD